LLKLDTAFADPDLGIPQLGTLGLLGSPATLASLFGRISRVTASMSAKSVTEVTLGHLRGQVVALAWDAIF